MTFKACAHMAGRRFMTPASRMPAACARNYDMPRNTSRSVLKMISTIFHYQCRPITAAMKGLASDSNDHSGHLQHQGAAPSRLPLAFLKKKQARAPRTARQAR